jgi:hypothetical protein
MTKRKFSRSAQDYSQEELYPHNNFEVGHWEDKDYQGGIFSDSAIGGKSQHQQNPWQGSQDQWQQP